jgi:hypothetical protein
MKNNTQSKEARLIKNIVFANGDKMADYIILPAPQPIEEVLKDIETMPALPFTWAILTHEDETEEYYYRENYKAAA